MTFTTCHVDDLASFRTKIFEKKSSNLSEAQLEIPFNFELVFYTNKNMILIYNEKPIVTSVRVYFRYESLYI